MSSALDHVILVDENDRYLGTMEKMEAHEKGALHRAFSVFIFNDKNELILQKRAEHKYHSGGLWTNTCCSHPRFGESVINAAHRRLKEEMGFDCSLEKTFDFVYKTDFHNGLSEHEFDHVLIGYYSGEINLNPQEACEWKAVNMDDLNEHIKVCEENFTFWFKEAFPKVYQHIKFDATNRLSA
jgi:isopentenyl-diphosphate delta-isomerase